MPNKGKLLDHHHLAREALADHWFYELWGSTSAGPFTAECMCDFETPQQFNSYDALVVMQKHLTEIWSLKPNNRREHTVRKFYCKDIDKWRAMCACGVLSDEFDEVNDVKEAMQDHLRDAARYG